MCLESFSKHFIFYAADKQSVWVDGLLAKICSADLRENSAFWPTLWGVRPRRKKSGNR